MLGRSIGLTDEEIPGLRGWRESGLYGPVDRLLLEYVEETKLRALAESHAGSPGVPDCSEVRQLVSSDAWVDLHEIVKDHVITGAGLGLKEVAPLAGFAWRDPEAGGDESMLWYREAVDHLDASRRETSRERLLAYNEDDVIATLRVRDWLEREARRLGEL